MKANELRIGNKFYLPNGEVGTISYHEIRLMTIALEKPNYQPIPITEEWLLKLGFQKTMSWTYVKDLVGNLKLVYYLGEKGWSIGFKSYSDFPNLKHVHQLQNLYFALTGEELTHGGNK
jgi:hypothetical protein